ncbi:PREDICTED: alpha-1-antichymotrypsin-like [Elephantulus edwardii]|uniref:alpha-1-antichymotrypsin-like n=1 Tax=Elephantulus edwardii TaxID=28737 RepID=UPI0003F0740E|nr:PREDICTED: alpha-1-antichymotrypsin-like [Elephantulus edwardii]
MAYGRIIVPKYDLMGLVEEELTVERMSSLLTLALLVAGLCPVVLCSNSTLTQENQVSDNETHLNLTLAFNNADFTFSLYKQLTLKKPSNNIVFSPLSVSTALAFVALGARNTTLREILQGLKFNLRETSETQIHQSFQHLLNTFNHTGDKMNLSLGNALFLEESLMLLEKFKEDAQELYRADIIPVNFHNTSAAVRLINDYVDHKTHGEIMDFISGLDPDTLMILVNYFFFKAKWKKPFDSRNTYNSTFHVSNAKSVDVPMMKILDLFIPYFRDEQLSCTVVELKYTGNSSALLILPDEGKMEEVEARLCPETLRRWKESIKETHIDELHLPKFSISGHYNLEEILPQLGIKEVFTHLADLSGMTGAKNVMISKMVHKAVIDVKEEGTEASAVTAVEAMTNTDRESEITILYFNVPFVLVITSEDTGTIYFAAKVSNPKEASIVP